LHIAFPFRLDSRGMTVTSDYESHIREMIEQVLFTMPGERVNRPDFGSGLMQLIFSPGSEELVAATQFLVQGSLQQWLGDLISVEEVAIESQDSILTVSVRYQILQSKSQQIAQFKHGV
jgi:phage baseplate assembly protein W